eukprot:jgi/Tetstr1/421415/TSEL_012364.t1
MASLARPVAPAQRAALSSRSSSALSGSFGRLALAAPRTAAPAASRSSVSVMAGRIGPGKDWEKIPLNKNGKPLKVKMHVKTGDTVVVVAGKDKGKVSEVVKVFTKTGAVVVKDANIKTKHMKPQMQGETGQIIQSEAPMHHSNVMHYSKAQNVRSRVGSKEEGGKKVRYLVKTGEIID